MAKKVGVSAVREQQAEYVRAKQEGRATQGRVFSSPQEKEEYKYRKTVEGMEKRGYQLMTTKEGVVATKTIQQKRLQPSEKATKTQLTRTPIPLAGVPSQMVYTETGTISSIERPRGRLEKAEYYLISKKEAFETKMARAGRGEYPTKATIGAISAGAGLAFVRTTKVIAHPIKTVKGIAITSYGAGRSVITDPSGTWRSITTSSARFGKGLRSGAIQPASIAGEATGYLATGYVAGKTISAGRRLISPKTKVSLEASKTQTLTLQRTARKSTVYEVTEAKAGIAKRSLLGKETPLGKVKLKTAVQTKITQYDDFFTGAGKGKGTGQLTLYRRATTKTKPIKTRISDIQVAGTKQLSFAKGDVATKLGRRTYVRGFKTITQKTGTNIYQSMTGTFKKLKLENIKFTVSERISKAKLTKEQLYQFGKMKTTWTKSGTETIKKGIPKKEPSGRILELGSGLETSKEATIRSDLYSRRKTIYLDIRNTKSFYKNSLLDVFKYPKESKLIAKDVYGATKNVIKEIPSRIELFKKPYKQIDYNVKIPFEKESFSKVKSSYSLDVFGKSKAYKESFKVLEEGGKIEIIGGASKTTTISKLKKAGFENIKSKKIGSDYKIVGEKPYKNFIIEPSKDLLVDVVAPKAGVKETFRNLAVSRTGKFTRVKETIPSIRSKALKRIGKTTPTKKVKVSSINQVDDFITSYPEPSKVNLKVVPETRVFPQQISPSQSATFSQLEAIEQSFNIRSIVPSRTYPVGIASIQPQQVRGVQVMNQTPIQVSRPIMEERVIFKPIQPTIQQQTQRSAIITRQMVTQQPVQVTYPIQRVTETPVEISKEVQRLIPVRPFVSTKQPRLKTPITSWTPPPFIPAFPSGIPQPVRVRKIGAKARYDYIPSYTAFVFKIYGKKAKPIIGSRYGGFELRPITRDFLRIKVKRKKRR